MIEVKDDGVLFSAHLAASSCLVLARIFGLLLVQFLVAGATIGRNSRAITRVVIAMVGCCHCFIGVSNWSVVGESDPCCTAWKASAYPQHNANKLAGT